MADKPLTKYLIERGVLQDKDLIKAFNTADRRDFLPASMRELYLQNRPLPIGHMQTNSQPFTVAFMLELLLPKSGEKILDVGNGSGWTAALLAATDAKVIGTERIAELVEFARGNLTKYNLDVQIMHTPTEVGWPSEAPYDKIVVSAAADEVPITLLNQLSDGGRMVIPVGESIQLVERLDSGIKTTNFDGFKFVPLVIS